MLNQIYSYYYHSNVMELEQNVFPLNLLMFFLHCSKYHNYVSIILELANFILSTTLQQYLFIHYLKIIVLYFNHP